MVQMRPVQAQGNVAICLSGLRSSEAWAPVTVPESSLFLLRKTKKLLLRFVCNSPPGGAASADQGWVGTSTGGGSSLRKSPGSTEHGQEIPNLAAPKQDQLGNKRGPTQMKMWGLLFKS